MTDITVTGADYSVENRSWVDADPGEWTRCSITLDLTAFDRETHYPNGYIPSGIALAPIGDGKLWGPADDATAQGFLWNTTSVKPGRTKVGGPLWQHGFVRENRLPVELSAPVKTALEQLPGGGFGFRSH